MKQTKDCAQARNQEGESPLEIFSPPLEKCVGHSSKNLGPSQKTLRLSSCPKLLTDQIAPRPLGRRACRETAVVFARERKSNSNPFHTLVFAWHATAVKEAENMKILNLSTFGFLGTFFYENFLHQATGKTFSECSNPILTLQVNAPSDETRAFRVGGQGSIPVQVPAKAWNTVLASFPASCSGLTNWCQDYRVSPIIRPGVIFEDDFKISPSWLVGNWVKRKLLWNLGNRWPARHSRWWCYDCFWINCC